MSTHVAVITGQVIITQETQHQTFLAVCSGKNT